MMSAETIKLLQACDELVEEIEGFQNDELEHISNKELQSAVSEVENLKTWILNSPNEIETHKEDLNNLINNLHQQQYKDEDIGCITDLTHVSNLVNQ